ncbi:VIT1/CCC1 transporter family protein [Ottowia sp.]|uniref:VIT1/CCC1 transporter family protein n=1 Tax=Ottowia sp. TaxID=1898956 RepID=UPI002CAA1633|nr:VIT1/CCC1 transporter family protein [Ottowia sp.]MCP5256419.1 VIT1/CCC1 transporter family protein [Burkholderiaceae bacterium]HRW72213.1 VIT1/CCC1 transporter family protein [Ottowia sp.]
MPHSLPRASHHEAHRSQHVGWLRAAVLGANDGLISTASLVVGMAAAGTSTHTLLLTALAGLVAGALSMAAGEYVSVSSQADTEAADRAREEVELAERPDFELEELKQIYVQRGLSPELAGQVAHQLTARDALSAHLRDELGLTEHGQARPLQAALASAAAFAAGALPPILLVLLWSLPGLTGAITASTLVLLAVLGALAARLGGAPVLRGAARVLFWGAMAMAATALLGHLFGAAPVA